MKQHRTPPRPSHPSFLELALSELPPDLRPNPQPYCSRSLDRLALVFNPQHDLGFWRHSPSGFNLWRPDPRSTNLARCGTQRTAFRSHHTPQPTNRPTNRSTSCRPASDSVSVFLFPHTFPPKPTPPWTPRTTRWAPRGSAGLRTSRLTMPSVRSSKRSRSPRSTSAFTPWRTGRRSAPWSESAKVCPATARDHLPSGFDQPRD